MDTKEKLSTLTISLHWIIALTVIALTAVGFYMGEFDAYALFPIHKSIGVLIFAVIIVRVIWRLKNGWPVPIREYTKIEQTLSHAVHWVLILCTLIMPISGFLMSGAGGFGVDIFGLVIVPANIDPTDPTKHIPYNEGVGHLMHEVHEVVGLLLAAAIALHIAGALKHHIIDKDRTLLRMRGK